MALHDFVSALARFGGVELPGFCLDVALLAVIEKRPLILLDIEEEARARAGFGQLRREARVGFNRGEIIKPIHFGGRSVEAEKVGIEPAEADAFEVGESAAEVRFGESLL